MLCRFSDAGMTRLPIKFVEQVGKLVYKTDFTVSEIAEEADEARHELKKP
jgi:hypothetical protein